MAAEFASFAASSAERAFDEVSMISTPGRLFCSQPRHCPSVCGWPYNFLMLLAPAVASTGNAESAG